MITHRLLTNDVRRLALKWIREELPEQLADLVELGLPEWDDRLDLWRVALVSANNLNQPVGEIQIERTGEIRRARSHNGG